MSKRKCGNRRENQETVPQLLNKNVMIAKLEALSQVSCKIIQKNFLWGSTFYSLHFQILEEISRGNSSLMHLRRKTFRKNVNIQHQTEVLLYNPKYSTWVGYFIVLMEKQNFFSLHRRNLKIPKGNCMKKC